MRVLLKVIKEPIIKIKSISTTGSKIDVDTVCIMMKYFPKSSICEYYGASELGHITYAMAVDILKKPFSVGKVLPGVDIKIKDNTIWVSSPYLAIGYQANATVGDMGYVDSDGYVYLKERANRIINVAGVKLVPADIEKVIKQCENIVDVIVGGVSDAIKGEEVLSAEYA